MDVGTDYRYAGYVMTTHTTVAWMLRIGCLLSAGYRLTKGRAEPLVRSVRQAITPASYKGDNCYKPQRPNGVEGVP